jgi:hypothetical protein
MSGEIAVVAWAFFMAGFAIGGTLGYAAGCFKRSPSSVSDLEAKP